MKFNKNYNTSVAKKIDKEEIFIMLTIFLSIVVLFEILWPIMFAVHDDIQTYMTFRLGLTLEQTIGAAREGRINSLITGLINKIPYIGDSILIYKVTFYGAICFSAWALWRLVKNNIGKNIGYLTLLLFFVLAQIDIQHNLLISYPVSLTIPIGIVLFSIDEFLKFYRINEKNNKNLIISAILLLISTILYETFLMFSGIIFLIAVANNYKEKRIDIKKVFYELRFHIIFMTTYLVIFIGWRMCFPSTYDGTTVASVSLQQVLKAILIYSTGMFPLNSTLRVIDSFSFNLLELVFIVKATIVAVATIVLIKQSEYMSSIKVSVITILGIVGMILSVIMHSLTSKYTGWIEQGTYGYVPSFYSYFFIIIILTIITVKICQRFNKNKSILILIGIVVFMGSILTDLNNKYYANALDIQTDRYQAFDRSLKSNYFKDIKEGSQIYIPDYMGIHHYMPFTEQYAQIYNTNKLSFTNKIEDLKFDRDTYAIKYNEDSECILMGRIDADMTGNEFIIISPDILSGKSLIVHKAGEGTISIDGIQQGEFENTAIIPLYYGTKEVKVSGQKLDILNSQVVKGKLVSNEIATIEFIDGFYGAEQWGEDIAYWCDGEGKISIENKSSSTKKILLESTVATGNSEEVDLSINVNTDDKIRIPINGAQQRIKIEVMLKPGQNEIQFSCSARPLENLPGDERRLVFYMLNMSLENIE